MSRKMTWLFIIILFFIILSRIPALLYWNKYVTGDDAAIYMDKAINIAEGRGFVNSISRDIIIRDELDEYVDKFGNKEQSLRVAPIYIYSLSAVYRLCGVDSFHHGINLFNLLMFIIFLTLLFYSLLREYPDRPSIAYLSLLFIGFHPLFFEFGFGAHMETMNLLAFFAVLLLHLKLIRKPSPTILFTALYGISLAFFMLTKYSAVPLICGYLLHLLYLRRFKDLLISGSVFLALVVPPMFLWQYLSEGKLITNFGRFPFSSNPQLSGIVSHSMYMIYDKITTSIQVLENLSGTSGMALLFPLLILSFIGFRKKLKTQLSVFFLVCILGFFLFYGYTSARYVIPTLSVFVPVSIHFMLDRLLPSGKKTWVAIAAMFVIIFSIQFKEIIEVTKAIRKAAITRETEINSSLSALKNAAIGEDDTVLTDIAGFQLFTRSNTVLAPIGIDQENNKEVIDAYGVDYILDAPTEDRISDETFADYQLLNDPYRYDGISIYRAKPEE